MRTVLITVSLIFLALAGIIAFKALLIPAGNFTYQPAPQESAAQASIPQKSVAQDLPAEPAVIVEQPVMEQAQVQAEKPTNKTRLLAVLGAGAFGPGQIVVSSELINDILAVVPEIQRFPDDRVLIEGHTDNQPVRPSAGSRYTDNMELSFLRAKAVADILVKNGISLDRISVTGYGDARPAASNDTYEGRLKNRRVEIKLTPAVGGF